jgi:effector-binding domain-containing protein
MYSVDRRSLIEQPTAIVRGKAAVHEISDFLAHAFGTVAAHLERLGLSIAGMPFARYRHLGGDEFEIEAGFPVPQPIEPEGEVDAYWLPGGSAAVTWHTGPYDRMGPAYEALAEWVERRGGVIETEAWEVYYSDPTEQPDPATWRTELIQPFREMVGATARS